MIKEKEKKEMKLNNIIAPDDKIIYVEPEMEVVLFDKSDLEI